MILAIAAALIIQTHDGQTRVVENLTDKGCAAARCLSQYGHSCEDEEKKVAAFRRWQEEARKHPVSDCETTGTGITSTTMCIGIPYANSPTAVPGNATKTAMCVK